MRRYLLLLLFPLNLSAQDLLLEKFVDSLIGPYNKVDVPGTFVLVAQDGKPKLKKTYGMASLEFDVPLTTNHAFAIGSVSKQFTAVAILQLAASGKIKLSEDIRKYIPELNSWGNVITIENMLTHSSGISSTERDGWAEFLYDNGVGVSPANLLEYVTSEKMLFKAGTNFSYNNVAYFINSILIERVSGQRFGDYMKDHVFVPAGMKNTYIASDLQPIKNLATSYVRGFEGKWRNENVRRNVWQWANGSGNVIITLDDLLQWDIALREAKILPAEWLKKAWTAYVLKDGAEVNYGYGFEVNNFNGLKMIGHGGSIYTYSCYSIHIPDKKLYIFYGSCYASDVTFVPKKIIGRMLNISPAKPVLQPGLNILDYVGTYDLLHINGRFKTQVSERPMHLKITSSGDSLFGHYPFREKVYLKPAGKDRFMAGRPEDQLIVFNRSRNGKVDAVFFEPFLFGSVTSLEKNMKITVPARPPAKIKKVNPRLLKSYAGTYYRPARDLYLFIETIGDRIFAYELNASSKFELLPISDDTFIRKGVEELIIKFKKNKKNRQGISFSGIRELEYTKISD
jgi:CubicO group peptidase (beta-lactamase class C family)